MPRCRSHRASAAVAALAAMLLLCRAAGAAISREAAPVVNRYLEVTGGAAAFAAERTTYTHAKVFGFGFEGVIETWSARPDRHYSRTALGPFQLAEGSDGLVQWRTDPTTGRVVRLADRDQVESKVSTWFELERWAEPDQGGGRVEVAGHERDSSGTYTVLAVDAPGAGDMKPHRLWFADASGLLARIESPHDQSWVTSTLSDWRLVAGRRRAMVTETGLASMPANRLRSVADSIAVNVPVTGVAFAPPDSSGGNALRWLSTEGLATLPFEYRARHVWLEASIDGGPPQHFLFDTGASITVLDSTFAASHGIKAAGYMQAAGAGAAGSASFATLGTLMLAGSGGDGVELRDLKVGVLSVNPLFSTFFWRDMAGIIGYDVISRFVTTIDYDRGVLVLHDPRTFRPETREAALPMVLNGVVPALNATIDGRYRGLFRLDVGSSSTVDVHTPFARANQLEKHLAHPMPVSGAGFGGTFVSVLGRMKSMAIGPYEWKEPMVSVARAVEGAFASEEFAGNIGNRVLERFRVTLDYDGRRVWLEPGKRYHDRDGFTRAGALLGWYHDRIEAVSVLPGSPAARAGLREGDRVVSIDGRPALGWELPALDALFDGGPDGRVVALVVHRDDRDVPLKLTLKEMLR